MSENAPFPLSITSTPDETRVQSPQHLHAGAQERASLPLRLVLVSDLDPQGAEPTWSEGTHLRGVDANRYASLMEAMAPTVEVEVANHLGAGPRYLGVQLTARRLADLTPSGIAAQVPALRRLLAVREVVASTAQGAHGLDTLSARLEEAGMASDQAAALAAALTKPAPSPPPGDGAASGDSLDRLLGMVDLGEDAPADAPPPADAPRSLLGALIGAATAGSDPGVAKDAAAQALDDFDAQLKAQIDAILAHPTVLALERAWRGLKFLVDRLDFRAGIRLDVLAAPKEALSEALYYQVLLPEHAAGDLGYPDAPPVSALLLDYNFGASSADLALLTDLAETGASLQVPVVATAGPAFFGQDKPTALSKLPPLHQLFAGPPYIAWRKLRERDEAAYLSLAAPAFVLRPAYGRNHPDRALPFAFETKDVLWGGAALLVGTALGASFAETGWPTHLPGRIVENLPIRKGRMGGMTLAALLADRSIAEFAANGILPLASTLNRDHAALTQTPTTRHVARTNDAAANAEAFANASLPSALFSSRTAQFLLMAQRALAGLSRDEMEAALGARLRSFLGSPDGASNVTLEHVAEGSTPDYELFAVRLLPPPSAVPYPVRLVLGAQIPTALPAS